MGAPRRIVVFGVTGSGKSTLARGIAARLGLPLHPVDDLMWEPNWVEVPTENQRERIAAICAGEAWVLDSMYGKWQDIPLERVELIVGLDYPRWLSLGRLVRRSLRRAVRRERCCNGNIEQFSKLFSRDSILLWHFRSFASKRNRMRRWKAEGRPVVLLAHPREAQQWLESL